jgi:transposase
MTAPSTPFSLFVGVDIAATSFAASWTLSGQSPARAVSFAQTPEGYTAFQIRLTATGIAPAATLIVLEATGSYWVTLAVTLHQTGFAVSVVNPAHAHNFVRSLPRRAKTDALDAQMLALFAAERVPPRWTPPPQVYHELRQRLVARDGLLSMRQQARNQRHALLQWPVVIEAVRDHLDALIAQLDTHLSALERDIAQVLQRGAWAESASLLTSITGIGMVTTAWLLVSTLNFTGCRSAEAAAAYAGLVPLARESGSSVRGRARIGHGGQARLRTALYMATLTAARFNPQIKAYYERLRAAGKPSKVARCAAARKLLHLAWAVVEKGQRYDPNYATQSAQVGQAKAVGRAQECAG